ncbi:MAG: LolA-related protein [Nitrospiraceae bacterium]
MAHRLRGLPAFVLFIAVTASGCIPAAPVEAATQGEPTPAPSEFTVDEVVRGLTRRQPQEVMFEEITFSTILTTPLRTKGILTFTPPSRLEKHVTHPQEERYIIDGDQVLYRNDKKRRRRSFSLEEYPALRMFVEIFRSALAGDPVTLKRYYQATVEGESRAWSLLLRPLDASSNSMVETVRLAGEGTRLTRVEILSADGDRSIVTLHGSRGE